VRLPSFEPRFSPEQQRAVDEMLAVFARDPFSPPTRQEVESRLGEDVTAALIERGTLVKISDSILLERHAYETALQRVVVALRERTTLTVADARDLLGTSRKYMLAIFEHLDERRITRRQGDDRLLGPQAPQPAGTSTDAERPSVSRG
jgi:selenocysteine-specific elongation factor